MQVHAKGQSTFAGKATWRRGDIATLGMGWEHDQVSKCQKPRKDQGQGLAAGQVRVQKSIRCRLGLMINGLRPIRIDQEAIDRERVSTTSVRAGVGRFGHGEAEGTRRKGGMEPGKIEVGCFRVTKNFVFAVQFKKPRYNAVGNGVPGGGKMVISFLRVWWGKCRLAGKDTRATWAARTDRRCWRFHNAWRLGKVHDGTSVGVSGMNGISLPSEFLLNHACGSQALGRLKHKSGRGTRGILDLRWSF